uniref:Metallopeptidase family protein n=1 Tax=Eiseniibacteriota bacterium TaxID=2212470 RepID=A0A832MKI0_UNCEI
MDFQTLTEHEWAKVDEVWEHIEDGDLEGARAAVDALVARRPGHPDVRIVEAAVALEEGEAAEALDRLRGAERSADPALFFYLRALAHFDLVRFEAARADAERALAVQPDYAEAHDLLSRVLEHLGRHAEAAEHAEEAARIDPEAFPAPLEMDPERFDRLVERSIEELPEKVRAHLHEVPVLVEDLPSPAMLTAEDPPLAPDLLGLFVGRHLMERSVSDLPSAPGAIYLFRRNLLRVCPTEEDLVREVRITVQHEVGHLLGLDEDDLERWGLA